MIFLMLFKANKSIILMTGCYLSLTFKENIMWTTPSAQEMRFGFEVTMYVMNK
mgnify:FL=1